MRRVYARGGALAILVLFLLLLPHSSTEVALASGSGTPGPLSLGNGAKLLVDPVDAVNGFTLIAPYNQFNVHLVDPDGNIVHTWASDRRTKGAVVLLENGSILRGRSGLGGDPPDGVHLLDWNSTVLWDYEPPESYGWHHDLAPLPNGNILINTVVFYPRPMMIGMGRDPSIAPELIRVEPILEIRPNGTTGGDVVWKWDPLDHLIQDYNPDLPNYGVVKDHPELVDINYPRVNMSEWQHTNAVAYNAELDQVMITNRNFDEIWVIDHSTTTEQAAGHSGGARGRGGDILYRWGNPRAYQMGNASDQVLYGPHDGQWIGPDLPGEGNILVFNNGMNLYMTRPEGKISTIEELVPPIDATGGYERDEGSAYGPADPVWSWNASPPKSFYAMSMGSVQRLPDGNTLVGGGSSNTIFEIAPDNSTGWRYANNVFKARRYYQPTLGLTQGLEAIEDRMQRVDLDPLLSDPDTDHAVLALDEDSPYASIAGHELRLLYPEGVLTEVFNLTVSDGLFGVVYDVRVTIEPVNDPLVLAPIPGISAIEGVEYHLDLAKYISDPDTRVDDMLITVDSSYATVEGGRLTLLYPDGVLTDMFRLTVFDGEFRESAEVLVTVTPVNDPPTVDRIPDQEGVEDVPWVLDLEPYIRDVDSPLEMVSVASDSQYASVSGWDLDLLYPDGVTRDVVRLSVSDGQDATVVAFNVTIEPVNDPPAFGDILPVTVTEDEPFLLDLGPAVLDVDTPPVELTLTVYSPFVAVDGLVLTLLYLDGVLHDEVAIEVWDGESIASATLVVDVEPVNDPPVWIEVPVIVAVEDVEGELDLGPYMKDVDTPHTELAVEMDSALGWMDGHVFRFTYPKGVLGEGITFTLTDGEFEVELRAYVSVTPATELPDPPVVPGNRPPIILDLSVSPSKSKVGDEILLTVLTYDADSQSEELEVWIDIILPDGASRGNFSMTHVNGTDGFTFVSIFDTDGEHSVVVHVGDGNGNWASRSVKLIIEPEDTDGPDGKGGPSTWVWATVAVLAAVIVVAATAVVARARGRWAGGRP